jgi:hypothetical protein
VLETFESFDDVSRHGYVDCGVNAVPVEGHLEGSRPIRCDGIHFFKGSEEVNGVVAAGVHDYEVVDDQ